MTKIGVIGCGRVAQRHLSAYNHLGGVEVVVADADPEAAGEFARKHGVQAAESATALLAGDVQGVDICVPNRFHAELVMAAAEQGKHVFCEKPLCVSVEEAEAVRGAADRANISVHVGYLYRRHPALRLAKRAVDDGIIGPPHLATFRLGGRGSHALWQHDGSRGGGAGHEMLVHMLDLAVWLLGEFSTADIHASEIMQPHRVIGGQSVPAKSEDFVLVSLSRPGVRAVLEADFVTPSYMNLIEIQGDGGSIFTSILHYLPTIVFCTESRGIFSQGNNFFNFPQTNLFEIELGEFVESLREGRISRESIADAIGIQWILDRISAAMGSEK